MPSQSWKTFERTVASRLGEWWDDDKKHFRRLYLKAGWPWADGKGPDVVRITDPSTKEPSPDFVDFEFPFWIECKKRKSFNFFDFLSQTPGEGAATSWYRETLMRAQAAKKEPMVFVRYPRSPRILIMLPIRCVKLFTSIKDIGLRVMRVSIPYSNTKFKRFIHTAAIVDSKIFFENVPVKRMKAYLKINSRNENA